MCLSHVYVAQSSHIQAPPTTRTGRLTIRQSPPCGNENGVKNCAAGEEPELRARIMQLLDAGPMRLRSGQPAVFLDLAHLGSVEPTMMLTQWDGLRLAALLVQALAIHGDEVPEDYFKHLSGVLDVTPAWREYGDPHAPPLPPPSSPSKRQRRPRKK